MRGFEGAGEPLKNIILNKLEEIIIYFLLVPTVEINSD